MRKVFTILGIIAMILTLATGILSTDAAAKKKGEIIWCSAGPSYPEYAEGLGVNIYLNALQGRFQTHRALKGKMHLKTMDKGMLFSTQDEALTGVASGKGQRCF